jgi:hypothetical protein
MNITQDDARRSFQAIRPKSVTQASGNAGNEQLRGVRDSPEAERIRTRLASMHSASAGRIRDVFANLA